MCTLISANKANIYDNDIMKVHEKNLDIYISSIKY